MVDQRDDGQFFPKFVFGQSAHSLEGVGDGLWSVFTICDALYDAHPGDMIAIDEPELSLHPALQRRVLEMLLEESCVKQIVLSTHSPYFIDWGSLGKGGVLYRFRKDEHGCCRGRKLGEQPISWICRLNDNLRNPTAMGLEAKEVFFLEDGIIVCEGQDDVVMFRKKWGTDWVYVFRFILWLGSWR